MGDLTLLPGRPFPLGAQVDDSGVNFALFSDRASSVQLCLYERDGRRELARLLLPRCSDGVWHGYLPLEPLQPHNQRDPRELAYGYRIDGVHSSDGASRFDPAKLLIDPYARAFCGEFRWHESHLQLGLDNAEHTLKARVLPAHDFDWAGDRPPAIALADTIVYEVHVKGFSALHPGIPAEQRGRFAGLAAPAAIEHLQRLGITAVSLLPVQQALDELPLTERGLRNYWGYNTIGFFAPDQRLALGDSLSDSLGDSHSERRRDPITEFKLMVRGLHAAGIEVILDVVYNHTAEGDQRGPVLSFKGIDNESYYHLRFGQPGSYENYTGTGNALNVSHPRVLQMVMDSLRYWVGEMHVDGFRFDLAPTLARDRDGFSRQAAFFACIAQDPQLAHVKLIAEPWDIGFGGYQLGQFPKGWAEWNDRFRDTVRSFWVRHSASRGELASRLAGSSELFQRDGRAPQASINFISAHDGFTLHDLVSYERKRNEANGEGNADGHSHNQNWNCGVDGPTAAPDINELRRRLKRAMLATLLLAQGTPMLLGGDELARTQQGNNNAYCQDNAINYFDWAHADQELITFTAQLIALRKRYPQLRQSTWLKGQLNGAARKDIVWLNRAGKEMTTRQWQQGGRFIFGLILAPHQPQQSDLIIWLNGETHDWSVAMPAGRWRRLLDTAEQARVRTPEPVASIVNADQQHAELAYTELTDADQQQGSAAVSGQVLLKARSVVVFEHIS